MDKTAEILTKQPLLLLEHYGIPSDMAEKLHQYFLLPEMTEACQLGALFADKIHTARSIEETAVFAQQLVDEHLSSDHFCHAMGWLALQRDYKTMQALYQAFPADKPLFAHAEWVVPFDDKRLELPFGNQYFLAYYNELYHYPDGAPPGILTPTGLCAQVLALISYRGWQSILPTTNQMIEQFNKLLWVSRDFELLSAMSGQPHEDFQHFFDKMVAEQEALMTQKNPKKEVKKDSLKQSGASKNTDAKTTKSSGATS